MNEPHIVTQTKIVIGLTSPKSNRDVYDFQVETNENFFVQTAHDSALLVHNCLLKPLEEAGSTDTVWILCSMDPSKFSSTTNGKAIAKRCTQFVLTKSYAGTVETISPVTGQKRFSTGEAKERQDVKIIESIITFDTPPPASAMKLGLRVTAYFELP